MMSENKRHSITGMPPAPSTSSLSSATMSYVPPTIGPSAGQSRSALFEVVGVMSQDRIDVVQLGDIYLRDRSALHQFELLNLTSACLIVHIRSEIRRPNHACSINFQHQNENLSLNVEDYNELFNEVGRIQAVVLQPMQRKPVVMSFRPSEPSFEAIGQLPHSQKGGGGTGKLTDATSTRASTTADSDEDGERYMQQTTSFIALKGKLILRAEKIKSGQESTESLPSPSPGLPLDDGGSLDSTTVIPIRGRLCRSSLRLDVPEILFDGCVVNGTYVKDFTVWNRSEIPLFFKLSSPTALGLAEVSRRLLELTEYDTGERLSGDGTMVPAFGNFRIRVTFRPKEVGEKDFLVDIENMHNERNLKTLVIHTVVTSDFQREGLVIREESVGDLGNGSVLHFGDIYTDTYVSRTLYIRNISQAALHLHFSSDRPKEISFELSQSPDLRRGRQTSRYGLLNLEPKGRPTPDVIRNSQGRGKYDESGDADADGDEDMHEEEDEEELDEEEDEVRAGGRDRRTTDALGDSDDEVADAELDASMLEDAEDQSSSHDDNDAEEGDDDYEFDLKKTERHRDTSCEPASRGDIAPKEKALRSPVRGTVATHRQTRSKRAVAKKTPEKSKGHPPRTGHSFSDMSTPTISENSESHIINKYRVEELTLAPGVERMILLWYCPQHPDNSELMSSSPAAVSGMAGAVMNSGGPSSNSCRPNGPSSTNQESGIDSKLGRLIRQTCRIFIRCREVKGVWQQAQKLDFDDSLSRMLSLRARTCTSLVQVNPVLNFGDCNIGEYKVMITKVQNLSELPAVITPRVNSQVVIVRASGDRIVIPPKQSYELKVELVPRSINLNYRRKITVFNRRNKWNRPTIEVRSCNMDTQHVIYHSLFYKLITNNRFRSPQVCFDHAISSSPAMKTFSLRNIAKQPLRLQLESSHTDLVIYVINSFSKSWDKEEEASVHSGHTSDANRWNLSRTNREVWLESMEEQLKGKGKVQQIQLLQQNSRKRSESVSHSSDGPQNWKNRREEVAGKATSGLSAMDLQLVSQSTGRQPRRRHLLRQASESTVMVSLAPYSKDVKPPGHSRMDSIPDGSLLAAGLGQSDTPPADAPFGLDAEKIVPERAGSISSSASIPASQVNGGPVSNPDVAPIQDLATEFEVQVPTGPLGPDEEERLVRSTSNRLSELEYAVQDGRLLPLSTFDNVLELDPEVEKTVVLVLRHKPDNSDEESHYVRTIKHRVFIRLLDITMADLPQSILQIHHSTHASSPTASSAASPPGNMPLPGPSDSDTATILSEEAEPLRVRELLVRAKMCRSVMSINQKNINLGRMTTSESQCKSVRVSNRSAVPLLYKVTKTGSISSGFLTINDGRMGVVRPFGSKEVQFVFQPTLAGKFEETLDFVNVEDPTNTQVITIKARVLKPDTFSLPQSGQVLNFGLSILNERCRELKIAVRNTSRKRREYAIQLDPSLFSLSGVVPEFFFTLDTTSGNVMTQVQEQKVEEEIEKLEHKLRIASTKKKAEKMKVLQKKLVELRGLLAGDAPTQQREGLENDGSSNTEAETGSKLHASGENDASASKSGPNSGSGDSRPPVNTLKFSLRGEQMGHILATAVFHQRKPTTSIFAGPGSKDSGSGGTEDENPVPEGAVRGRGPILLFETKNKDVIKDLVYDVDLLPGGKPGEIAYAALTGKPYKRPSVTSEAISVSAAALPQLPSGSGGRHERGPGNAQEFLSVDVICKAPDKPFLFQAPATSTPGVTAEQTGKPSNSIYFHTEPSVTGIGTSSAAIHFRHNSLTKQPISVSLRWKDVPQQLVVDEQIRSFAIGYEVVPLESLIQQSQAIHGGNQLGQSSKSQTQSASTTPPTSSVIVPEPMSAHSTISRKRSPANQQRPPVTLRIDAGSSATITLRWASATLPPTSSGIINVGTLELRATNTRGLVKHLNMFAVVSTPSPIVAHPTRLDLGKHVKDSVVTGNFRIANTSDSEIKVVLIPLLKSSPVAVVAPLNAVHGERKASGVGETHAQSGSSSAPAGTSTNTSQDIPQVSASDLQLEQRTLSLAPRNETTVSFSIRAGIPGRQTRDILIRSLSNRSEHATVTVSLMVSAPIMLHVPQLDPTCTGRLSILDVGHCYVRPKLTPDEEGPSESTVGIEKDKATHYAKTISLEVRNVSLEALFVTARSNLQKQCYVFRDSTCTSEIVQCKMEPQESRKLYIALQPRLLAEEYKTGACRELTGGIKVTMERRAVALATDDNFPQGKRSEENRQLGLSKRLPDTASATPVTVASTAEFTIAFKALAGISLLHVAPTFINLGSVTKQALKAALGSSISETPSQLRSKFTLCNLNRQLQLEYRIRPENVAGVDEGDVFELVLDEVEGTLAGGESKEIEFRVSQARSGLLQKRLVIENLSSPGQYPFVDIRLFVDEGLLHTSLHGAFTGAFTALGKSRSTENLKSTSGGKNAVGPTRSPTSSGDILNLGRVPIIDTSWAEAVSGKGTRITPTTPPTGLDDSSGKKQGFLIYDSQVAQGVSVESSTTSALARLRLLRNRSFVLTNASATVVHLQPLSNLPLVVSWEPIRRTSSTDISRAGDLASGPFQSSRKKLTSRLLHGESRQALSEDVSTFEADHWLDVHPGAGGAKSFAVDVLRSCGPIYSLLAGDSIRVSIKFKWLASTQMLPSDTILSGRQLPFRGILAFLRSSSSVGENSPASFAMSPASNAPLNSAQSAFMATASGSDTTVLLKDISKVVSICGSYCRSWMEVTNSLATLGKVGCIDGWRPRRFSITIQNTSETMLNFGIGALHSDISVVSSSGEVYMATHTSEDDIHSSDQTATRARSATTFQQPSPPKRQITCRTLRDIAVEALKTRDDDAGAKIWCVEPLQQCTISFDFKAVSRRKGPDIRRYYVNLVNYDNPANTARVRVEAEVITRLLSVHLHDNDPAMQKVYHDPNSLLLPTLTVPTSLTANPFACNVWFSVRNVYDEELELDLDCEEALMLKDILHLEILSRSSNTPLKRTNLAPNERVDIRVVCRALPHARVTAEILREVSKLEDISHEISSSAKTETKSEKDVIAPTGETVTAIPDTSSALLPNPGVVISDETPAKQKTVPEISGSRGQGHQGHSTNLTSVDVLRHSTISTTPISFGTLTLTALASSSDSELASHNVRLHETLEVLGTLQPGPTFSLSSSSLHFYTTVENTSAIPTVIEERDEEDAERERLSSPNMSSLPENALSVADSYPAGGSEAFSLTKDSTLDATIQGTDSGIEADGGGLLPSSQALAKPVNKLLRLRGTSDSFWIQNLSDTEPVNFEILSIATRHRGLRLMLDDEGSGEVRASTITDTITPVVSPAVGTVAPKESTQITVKLSPGGYTPNLSRSTRKSSWENELAEEDDSFSQFEGMALIVRDRDAPATAQIFKKVDVKLIVETADVLLAGPRAESVSTRHYEDRANDDDEEDTAAATLSMGSSLPELSANRLPVLGLRGCTPIQGGVMKNVRYAIDIGQQTLRTGNVVEWEITVERMQPSLDGYLEYRIYHLHQDAEKKYEWLQLSRDRGTLDQVQAYHNITLYFMRDRLGYFSTYLILENLTNAGDVKIIRVDMEVVADMKILSGMSSDNSAPLFDVLVAGKKFSDSRKALRGSQSDQSLSAPRPPLEINYGDILYNTLYHNRSIVIVNTSDLPLDFVLSSNVGSRELRFSLSATSLKPINSISIEAKSRLAVFFRFFPRPQAASEDPNKPGPSMTADSAKPWRREVEVYVACRLVKDFQQIIYLRCRCCYPTLNLKIDRDRGSQSPVMDLQSSTDLTTALLSVLPGPGPIASFSGPTSSSGTLIADDSVTGPHILSLAFVGRKIDLSESVDKEESVGAAVQAGRGSGAAPILIPSASTTALSSLAGNLSPPSSGGLGLVTAIGMRTESTASMSTTGSSSTLSTVSDKKTLHSSVNTAVSHKIRVEIEENLSEGQISVKNTKNVATFVAIRNDTMFFLVNVVSVTAQCGTDDPEMSPALASPRSVIDEPASNNSILSVRIPPMGILTLAVRPNVEALATHHLRWHRHVEEHITIYNRHHFPEKYNVSLRFTSGRSTNFYLAPGTRHEYPFSTLEDTIAGLLRSFSLLWKQVEAMRGVPGLFEDVPNSSPRAMRRHTMGSKIVSSRRETQDPNLGTGTRLQSQTRSNVIRGVGLLQQLQVIENALEELKKSTDSSFPCEGSQEMPRTNLDPESSAVPTNFQIAKRYSEVYFDFFYITDQLVWYAVKKNVGRFAFNLANLVYTVVFSHRVFRFFLSQPSGHRAVTYPSLLVPWVNQLGHFLSFFPETLDVIEPLLTLYDDLSKCIQAKPAATKATSTVL